MARIGWKRKSPPFGGRGKSYYRPKGTGSDSFDNYTSGFDGKQVGIRSGIAVSRVLLGISTAPTMGLQGPLLRPASFIGRNREHVETMSLLQRF